jgi:hypothetical protein
VSSFSPTTSDAKGLTSVPANPPTAVDAPPTYSSHAYVQSLFADTELITEKLETSLTLTSTADKKPFPVGLILQRLRPAFIDSKGKFHREKMIDIKPTRIMIHADMDPEDFTFQNWKCIYDTFGLRGYEKARPTKGEKAAGARYYKDEAWVKKVAGLVADHEAGLDPFYCLSFSFTRGQRVMLENETKLSFSLKKLLDRVLFRGRRQ